MKHDSFQSRHIGPDTLERDEMLKVVGAPSLDALMDEVIPASIRLAAPLDLPAGQTESEYLRNLRQLAAQNQIFRSFIGLGYYDCITPSVIIRNVLENPGWYTPYTPYQAEVSQGRLEGLLNFQTMVRDLTGMDIANASLLDEPTAAAEAMTLMYRAKPGAWPKRKDLRSCSWRIRASRKQLTSYGDVPNLWVSNSSSANCRPRLPGSECSAPSCRALTKRAAFTICAPSWRPRRVGEYWSQSLPISSASPCFSRRGSLALTLSLATLSGSVSRLATAALTQRSLRLARTSPSDAGPHHWRLP